MGLESFKRCRSKQMTRDQMLARLREHPLFKAALAAVDEKQAKRIAALAEGFLVQAADGLAPLVSQASDPRLVAEAKKALEEDEQVVIVEPVSGSQKA